MGKTILLYGFPVHVSPKNVKEFVEQYTGEGTVSAARIKLGKKAYAIVQFGAVKDAELILSLASQRLWYGGSYLKARKCDHDVVSKPRDMSHSMNNITLHFGCQTSTQRFATLWKAENASVSFGLGMKKMYFLLSDFDMEYKFELWYENIWRIQLRHCHGQPVKQLLIQLVGAPRIYAKETLPFEQIFDFYIWDYVDDHWVRTTDFTPSCRIGQSSAICLEIPSSQELPNFSENFVHYEEDDVRLSLDIGPSYSCNLELVPIVGPPEGINLPYNILFKVCILVQQGCLSGLTLDTNFYRLVDPHRMNTGFIEYALEKLYHLKECCYEPVKWLKEQHIKFMASARCPKPFNIALDAGLVYTYRVQITPSKIFFCGPEVNVSNRVLRNYPHDIENFLRVSFVDEEFGKMFSTDLCSKSSSAIGDRRTAVYKRVLSTLRDGIAIGGKKFEFLAFSSSQLRENSAWFFASRPGLTVSDIRAWMGDFSRIKNVAKYAARLGQSFGSSTETLSVQKHEVDIIPDVIRGLVKYNFSDGIGKISAEFACRVGKECGLTDFVPSAFQIRYGGYKGVVAVDPSSSMKLSLRKSMCKYDSTNTKLDVLGWSKYQPCFLNRQLITLLSTLGVPDRVFEKKQREAIRQLDSILTDPLRAQEALELMSPGENTHILKQMLLCGYKPDSEPFLSMMLRTFRASKLYDLRIKTRIFVPGGRALMGCLDETGTLEYGQVFVRVSSFLNSGSDSYVETITGNVVVAKNPCLHPGDVRVLQAVNVPGLHHMVNCVVFPQKGPRPHPNECSGSDLDGDIYFVCWDHELIPSQMIQPMDYTPRLPKEEHNVTIENVQVYFTDYIVNDSLGIISNAHVAFADKETEKAMAKPCLQLAELFSIAVDFPKTGVPAVIPMDLQVRVYPDFMEKADKPSYTSWNVIGKLFREVRDILPDTKLPKFFTREVACRSYDPDMEFDGYEDHLYDAFYYKTNYDYKLGNMMDYYGIKTEAEILSGGFMKVAKSFNKRRDADAIKMAVQSLRKEARNWFNEQGSGRDSGEEIYARASAWYYVTYHPSYYGAYDEGLNRDHYLSFAWCVYDKLVAIKKKNVNYCSLASKTRQMRLV